MSQSRRDFLKTSALVAGAAGTLAACGNGHSTSHGHQGDDSPPRSEGLPITVAGYPYDRLQPGG